MEIFILSLAFFSIFFTFRISFHSLFGPFRRFDSFSGFLGSESNEPENKEEIHIPESSDYKINLSKDKSGK